MKMARTILMWIGLQEFLINTHAHIPDLLGLCLINVFVVFREEMCPAIVVVCSFSMALSIKNPVFYLQQS